MWHPAGAEYANSTHGRVDKQIPPHALTHTHTPYQCTQLVLSFSTCPWMRCIVPFPDKKAEVKKVLLFEQLQIRRAPPFEGKRASKNKSRLASSKDCIFISTTYGFPAFTHITRQVYDHSIYDHGSVATNHHQQQQQRRTVIPCNISLSSSKPMPTSRILAVGKTTAADAQKRAPCVSV